MTNKSILTQIYEIQTPHAAEKLVDIGVDHIGSVVLDEQQWKNADLRDTVRLVRDSGAKSSLLPLFSPADAVSRVLDYYQPDMIHLCETIGGGAEKRGELDKIFAIQAKIRKRFPEIAIMRSVPVGTTGMAEKDQLLEIVARFEPVSDYFLTDTVLPPPPGSGSDRQPVPGFVGITGIPCNWDLVSVLVEFTRHPVILAGGISPENVYEAIDRVRPAGVDSCTRTNRDDGRGGFVRFEKDYEKVRRLIEEVRRAETDGLLR